MDDDELLLLGWLDVFGAIALALFILMLPWVFALIWRDGTDARDGRRKRFSQWRRRK